MSQSQIGVHVKLHHQFKDKNVLSVISQIQEWKHYETCGKFSHPPGEFFQVENPPQKYPLTENYHSEKIQTTETHTPRQLIPSVKFIPRRIPPQTITIRKFSPRFKIEQPKLWQIKEWRKEFILKNSTYIPKYRQNVLYFLVVFWGEEGSSYFRRDKG